MLNVIRSAVHASVKRSRCIYSTNQHGSIGGSVETNDGKDTMDLSERNSHTKFKIDRSRVPEVNEADLEEKFISGWGPGGQKVNKAVNCCQLKHKPTGLVVKVHQSRSLEKNRKIARELLAQRLDNLYNGDQSIESQLRHRALIRISSRENLAEKRRDMRKQFKQIIAKETIDD